MKTATAPSPAPAKVGFGWKLLGVGLVATLVFLLGQSAGWWGGQADPDQQPEGDNVLAVFELIWGQIRETGEVYHDTGRRVAHFECEDRELNITIYVDGEPYTMQYNESDSESPCTFRHHMAVAKGSELRMLVEEVGSGGWKFGTIHVEGQLALPNGLAIVPDGGDLEVWGIAF